MSQMEIAAPNCYIYMNDTANMSYSTIKAAKLLYAGGTPNETGARFPEATPAPDSIVADPCPTIRACAYLTKLSPTTSGCPSGNFNGNGQTIGAPGKVTCFRNLAISGVNETVCGLIEITGTELQLNGSSTHSCSSGVTFALSVVTIVLNFSNASLTLAPPTTGKSKGILFFRPAAQSDGVNFSNCSCDLAGMLYFPSSRGHVHEHEPQVSAPRLRASELQQLEDPFRTPALVIEAAAAKAAGMSRHHVADVSEIPPEAARRVVVDHTEILVCNVDGKFYAIEDVCSHDGGPLDQGTLEGACVVCPRHGATFDVRTGEALTLPAVMPVQTYAVDVEGDRIFVDV